MALLRQCLQELRAKLREPDAIDGVWPERPARPIEDARFDLIGPAARRPSRTAPSVAQRHHDCLNDPGHHNGQEAHTPLPVR